MLSLGESLMVWCPNGLYWLLLIRLHELVTEGLKNVAEILTSLRSSLIIRSHDLAHLLGPMCKEGIL